MEVYTVTADNLTQNANVLKEAFLLALERDGLLKKKAEEIAASYVIVARQRGWFGRLFKRLSGEEPKDNQFIVDILKVV